MAKAIEETSGPQQTAAASEGQKQRASRGAASVLDILGRNLGDPPPCDRRRLLQIAAESFYPRGWNQPV